MGDKVERLVDWLLDHGVQPITDRPYTHRPREIGWRAWMQQGIEDSDLVLVVCTPRYKSLVEKRNAPEDGGRGAAWEGAIITDHFYQSHMRNNKFHPVLPDGGKVEDIPRFLRDWYNGHRFPSGY